MHKSSPLDLSGLQRSPTASGAFSTAPRKRPITRLVIPVTIVGGFVALLLVSAGNRLMPQHAVTVVPVLVTESQVARTGAPLFQAAGWVEPRPQAVSVAALAAGVVDELFVVEGQTVERDEPIARLFTEDAELLLRQADANVALRKSELERCEAELKAAAARVEQPVHIEVLLAEANGMLAKSKTELARIPFLIEAARSAEAFAKSNWEGKQAAQDGLVGRVVEQAENEYATTNANLRELLERQPFLQKEVDALEKKVAAIQTQRELLIDEKRQWEEAKAKVRAAAAMLSEAEIQVEQAKLNLSRMVVRAPIRGRILRLLVSRGTRVMGLETSAGQNSSTVAQMYDPDHLQVRADVRLEDVPKIRNGQLVEIKTPSTHQTIQGRVLQATSSANIQKNTLEVKVELISPPPSVCPEMLVTATFLSPDIPSGGSSSARATRILIPTSLVEKTESGSAVWLVDEHQRAIRKRIALGQTVSRELSEVVNGLNPTDKLIVQGREHVSQGVRVRIVGEDQTLGAGQ